MEERCFIKVGNCFVQFIGLRLEVRMRPDYHKATPYLTDENAKTEAKARGIKGFKSKKNVMKCAIHGAEREENMYRVKYTDYTGNNDSNMDYPTKVLAIKAIGEELESVKEYFRKKL